MEEIDQLVTAKTFNTQLTFFLSEFLVAERRTTPASARYGVGLCCTSRFSCSLCWCICSLNSRVALSARLCIAMAAVSSFVGIFVNQSVAILKLLKNRIFPDSTN